MADIDFVACEMCLLDVGRYRLWCGDCHDIARARLAEVECEWQTDRYEMAEWKEAAQAWESDFRDINAAHSAAEDECRELKARLAAVRALCAEILDHFNEKGHPGRPCLRTGWMSVETVEKWRAVLAAVDGPQPAPPAEMCACGHGEAAHKDAEGEWTCCHPMWRCGCLAYWGGQRAAVDPPAEVGSRHLDYCNSRGCMDANHGQRAAVDPPAEPPAEDWATETNRRSLEIVTQKIADADQQRAAVDPPADHIAIFDGPPMRAAVDGPQPAAPVDSSPHRFYGSGGSQWCDTCGEADNDPIHAAGGLLIDVSAGQSAPAEVCGIHCAGFDEGRCTCDDPDLSAGWAAGGSTHHAETHEPGVADCPCTSCVDRFLDGQQ